MTRIMAAIGRWRERRRIVKLIAHHHRQANRLLKQKQLEERKQYTDENSRSL